ncbi:MAG: helix-turn-helix transcriptional regulator [Lachnospiraceae bacterium]|nr:helix-turn-helix transcriptional regulator [Lachnospiraceae bacterium]
MNIYWNGDSKNLIGPKLKQLRIKEGLSQAKLAARLQLLGMECNDLTILRIEQGSRFVPDYEVSIIAKYFHITTDELLGQTEAEQ